MEKLNFDHITLVIVTASVSYIAIIVLVRLYGLRSFSKMSSFDFAMTVAIGSMVASASISTKPLLVEGVVGLGTIFILQAVFGYFRSRSKKFHNLIDNTPILLMVDGFILENNLEICQVSKEDLYAKLREANVYKFSQVKAVIMETTGDISVIHAEDNLPIEKELLEGVMR
ncbi:MAG: DUF421 domain-containing protein [Candidatus Cyclobacteriaceae bacterium M2_1C_046]